MHDVTEFFGIFGGLQTPGSTNPHVTFRHLADRAGLNQLDHAAIVIAGVNLSAHLSGHVGSCRSFPNYACFVHTVGQRFFTVHMLAELQGGQCGKCVRVFAGADDDRIKFSGAIEDAAEVGVRASLSMGVCRPSQIAFVHITQCSDVFRRNGLQIATSASAAADDGNPQLIETGSSPYRTTQKQTGRQRGRAADKRTTSGGMGTRHTVLSGQKKTVAGKDSSFRKGVRNQ